LQGNVFGMGFQGIPSGKLRQGSGECGHNSPLRL
jgi:hypothetical protein